MALHLDTPPTTEPVTLSEAKTHLRVDTTADDDLISALITTARETAESILKRALITQTWTLFRDWWPDQLVYDEAYGHVYRHGTMYFEVPLPPLQTVSSIKYIKIDGTTNTVDPSIYIVDTDSEPGRVALKWGKAWPGYALQPVNGFQVQFTAGYGDTASDVPEPIKSAMLLMIGHWYEHRESVSETKMQEVPLAAKSLLMQRKVFS